MKSQTCPRCSKKYSDYPATSRRDNKTHICSACGTEEAMFDFQVNELKRKEQAWLQKSSTQKGN